MGRSRQTLAGTVADARTMERLMLQLHLSEGDLEDRRVHRPTAYRCQLLMYRMRVAGMSIRRVGLLLDRDRTCVRRAEAVIRARIAAGTAPQTRYETSKPAEAVV